MNHDDLKIAHIIQQGKHGDIVIVGSPFCYARKRCINKGGQDNGPCCVRRFFVKVGPLVNPQYEISIEKVKISDYGNIDFKVQEENNYEPQKCISKITSQIYQLLANNKFPFIFGGSKQSLYGSALAFQKHHKEAKHILISGKPNLRRPYDQNKLTSQSILTLLKSQFPYKIILFAASTKYFPKQYTSSQFEHISYEQIRKTPYKKSQKIYTQAGYKFDRLLQENKQIQNIHISLTVQVIQRFKGCRDIINVGLTNQQIIEIFFILGTTNNVKMIDISQFNPSVQDYQSSLLLVNLLYYFTMGWSKRI